MAKVQFFYKGKYLGETDTGPAGRSRDFFSYIFFCPKCGEIWGRSIVENARFVAVPRPCAEHGGNEVFFSPFHYTHYPTEVIAHDLERFEPGEPLIRYGV